MTSPPNVCLIKIFQIGFLNGKFPKRLECFHGTVLGRFIKGPCASMIRGASIRILIMIIPSQTHYISGFLMLTSFNFKTNGSKANPTSKTESTATVAVRKVSSKSTGSEDTSDDGRGSSVSPTLQPKLRPMIGRTKSQPKTSGLHHGGGAGGHHGQPQQKGDQKFVRSLNQHIQQSSLLYQQSGTQMILHNM